jgi:CHAT domain-containing protein/tetratricopeptide (TPR) repeat protein
MRRRETVHRIVVLALMFVCGAPPVASARAQASATLEDSVRVLFQHVRPGPAEQMLRAALTKPLGATRADSLQRATWLDLLAESQWRAQRPKAQAESIAALAVGLRQALHGTSSSQLARTLATQARVWRWTRSPDSALAGFERALEMHERHVPAPDTISADILVFIGNVSRQLGNFEDAVRALERALSIRRAQLGRAHREVGRALLNLAIAYSHAGRIQARLEAEREAIEILERSTPLDSLGVYYATKNHTGALNEAFQADAAGPYVARVLELRPRLFPSGGQEEADIEEVAGLHLMGTGDLNAARQRFERCADIYAAGVPDFVIDSYGRYLLTRGKFEELRGSLDTALSYVERAASLFRQRFEQSPSPFLGRAWGASLDRAGRIHARMDSLAAAERAFAQAAALFDRHRARAHPDLARATAELAAVRLRMGDLDSAATAGLRAAAGLTHHMRSEFTRMTEQEALHFRGNGAAFAINILLSVLSQKSQDASLASAIWTELARDAGLVAAEITTRRRLLLGTPDSTLTAWTAELVRVRARRAELELHARDTLAIASMRQRATDLERHLASRSARFASDLMLAAADPESMRAAIPANARLLHYVKFLRSGPATPGLDDERAKGRAIERPVGGAALEWYGAFVLARGGGTRFVSLGPCSQIDPLVSAWLRALTLPTPPDERARSAGRALRRLLWDPFAADMSGAELALIVPDGAVATLPFATLPGRSGSPLLEDGPYPHLLSSPRELIRRDEPPASERALIVGGANFGARLDAGSPSPTAAASVRGLAGDCRELRRLRFERLPGSGVEATHLGRLWSKRSATRAELLTGDRATELELRRRMPGSQLVHVATHGYSVPDSCAHRLGLGPLEQPDDRDAWAARSPAEVLLRTGLALAGANSDSKDPGNDGLLSAADIALLDLTGTRLVTLSACESGRGATVSAEGVIGLRWALMQAGAKSTLTSCYRIGDELAALWMDKFYAAWLDRRLSVPAAASTASRELRRQLLARTGADIPGQWGAFVTSGDWR